MIKSKTTTPEYRDGWDRIFGKKQSTLIVTGAEGELTPEQVAEIEAEYEQLAADEYEGSAPD
jgi:hypothetical protein